MSSRVIITGAGLCGTLLALQLANRGHRVTLLEKRGDLRKETMSAGRSINLALSDRGLAALELAGLKQKALDISIPMLGRMIHIKGGGTTMLLPYSGRQGEHIQSISRPGLNALLLDAATDHPLIDIFFNHGVQHADVTNARVLGTIGNTSDTFDMSGDVLIGTDGAGSEVRNGFLQIGSNIRFNYNLHWLDHGYKELEIPAAVGNTWQLEKNALHILPRQSFMVIALPNLDGSFTVTLFLAYDSTPGFNQLHKDNEIMTFFTAEFPDLLTLMPNLLADFKHHPTGALGTVKCGPWHTDRSLLMGDAAHAVVPFYGQGMNCAMEDVLHLNRCLDDAHENWSAAFNDYYAGRKKDTDAIADLAVENYYEMRDHVDNPNFIAKRAIEMKLEKKYPDYASKYNLVTFCEQFPYSYAKEKGNKQDKWLLAYCSKNDTSSMSEDELQKIYEALKEI